MKRSFLVSTFLSVAALSLSGYAKSSFIDSEDVKRPLGRTIKKMQKKITKKRLPVHSSVNSAKRSSTLSNDLKKSPLIKKSTQIRKASKLQDQHGQKAQKNSAKLEKEDSDESPVLTKVFIKSEENLQNSLPAARNYYLQAEKLRSQIENHDDRVLEIPLPSHLSQKIQGLEKEAENLRIQADNISEQIQDIIYPAVNQKIIKPGNGNIFDSPSKADPKEDRLSKEDRMLTFNFLSDRTIIAKTRYRIDLTANPKAGKKVDVLSLKQSALKNAARKIEEQINKLEEDFYKSARKKQVLEDHPKWQRYNKLIAEYNELIAKGDEISIPDLSKKYNLTPLQKNKNHFKIRDDFYFFMSEYFLSKNSLSKNSLMSEQAHQDLNKAINTQQKIVSFFRVHLKGRLIILSNTESRSYKGPFASDTIEYDLEY